VKVTSGGLASVTLAKLAKNKQNPGLLYEEEVVRGSLHLGKKTS